MQFEYPDPVEVKERKAKIRLGSAQAGHLLGLGRHPVERLRRMDYLASPSLAAVEDLASRPTVSGGIPVLRLGDAGVDAFDGNRRIGHERADTNDVLETAALKYWGGPTEAVVNTGWLAASVSGFVVALFEITGRKEQGSSADGYVRYEFLGSLVARSYDLFGSKPEIYDESFRGLALDLVGNRVPNPPGSPIVIV